MGIFTVKIMQNFFDAFLVAEKHNSKIPIWEIKQFSALIFSKYATEVMRKKISDCRWLSKLSLLGKIGFIWCETVNLQRAF